MCVPSLWVYFILFFTTPDERSWILICGQDIICVLTAANEGIYWSFIWFLSALPWFGRCRIWRRCRLEKAPSFSQSTHVQSSNLLVQLWPQLTSAFFLNSRWQKQRPYANWQWQVSTWTTAERKKNQRYLSLIYFNAKTVYWVQTVFVSHRNTVATSTVPSRVPV